MVIQVLNLTDLWLFVVANQVKYTVAWMLL
jgi:hypothetical protein